MPEGTATMSAGGVERVGDAEREAVARLLAEATGEGLLQFEEMDERLTRALAARTTGDLAALTSDLPTSWLQERRRAAARSRMVTVARRGFAEHLRWYLVVMAGLVAIWLAVGVTAGAWYPWPVWPALGWGIGVFSHARTAYGADGPLAGRTRGCRTHARQPAAES